MFEVVAINDPFIEGEYMAYMFKYDRWAPNPLPPRARGRIGCRGSRACVCERAPKHPRAA